MLASIRNSSRLLRCASSFKAASTVSTRSFHSSGVLSAEEKGPIEKELDQKTLDFQAFLARNVDAAGLDGDHVPLKVSQLADAIVGLSMVEAMQLGEALKKRLGITDSMLMGSISGLSVAAAPAEAAGGAAAAEPAKAEKSTVSSYNITWNYSVCSISLVFTIYSCTNNR